MQGNVIGNWKAGIKHSQHYFMERYCTVDCRGDIAIDDTTVFGYGVNLISMSHDISQGTCGPAVSRKLRIDGHSWIASFCLLAGCWVQEHAVVAGGAVVSGVIVPAYTLVQGNPAKIVARYNLQGKAWERLTTPEDCPAWKERKA